MHNIHMLSCFGIPRPPIIITSSPFAFLLTNDSGKISRIKRFIIYYEQSNYNILIIDLCHYCVSMKRNFISRSIKTVLINTLLTKIKKFQLRNKRVKPKEA